MAATIGVPISIPTNPFLFQVNNLKDDQMNNDIVRKQQFALYQMLAQSQMKQQTPAVSPIASPVTPVNYSVNPQATLYTINISEVEKLQSLSLIHI